MKIHVALNSMLKLYFSSDIDIMSLEAKEIFSNPEDKKLYLEAVKKLRKNSHKEKITLSNKQEITLVS
jgi:uncharacterized protein YqgQ